MRPIALVLACLVLLGAPARASDAWIESWGTPLPIAVAPPGPMSERDRQRRVDPPPPFVAYPPAFSDQTIRMVVRTSAGGPRFRLEFRNVSGGPEVEFGSLHAALAAPGGSIVPGTDRAVTFGGERSVTLFPGATMVSDPIDLAVPPLTEVAVSIYLQCETPATTVDELGLMPTYIATGNQVGAVHLDNPETAGSYFWLKGLSVPSTGTGGTIVALGDSITEGYSTTAGRHASWPELLAERLQADDGLAGWGVVNAGISGNRVLKYGVGDAAVARFDQDVLARPGVRWIVVLESINDINMSIIPGVPADQAVTAEQIIAGLNQLVERAHMHGLRVAGGTVMATKGLPFYTAEGEAMRTAVNDWIRHSGRFDAVIDFDKVTRDPADPLRIRPDIDPGDHVHPNDLGNIIMAQAIDLDIFRERSGTSEIGEAGKN